MSTAPSGTDQHWPDSGPAGRPLSRRRGGRVMPRSVLAALAPLRALQHFPERDTGNSHCPRPTASPPEPSSQTAHAWARHQVYGENRPMPGLGRSHVHGRQSDSGPLSSPGEVAGCEGGWGRARVLSAHLLAALCRCPSRHGFFVQTDSARPAREEDGRLCRLNLTPACSGSGRPSGEEADPQTRWTAFLTENSASSGWKARPAFRDHTEGLVVPADGGHGGPGPGSPGGRGLAAVGGAASGAALQAPPARPLVIGMAATAPQGLRSGPGLCFLTAPKCRVVVLVTRCVQRSRKLHPGHVHIGKNSVWGPVLLMVLGVPPGAPGMS